MKHVKLIFTGNFGVKTLEDGSSEPIKEVDKSFSFDDQNAASPTRTLVHTLIQHITSVFSENSNAEFDLENIQIEVTHEDAPAKVAVQRPSRAGAEFVDESQVNVNLDDASGSPNPPEIQTQGGAPANTGDKNPGSSGTGFQSDPAPGSDGASNTQEHRQDTSAPVETGKPAPSNQAASKPDPLAGLTKNK